ncbi:MAG: hypothetical protein WC816_04315 [Sphingomonas sp.]|jgi:hypothetical protein
MRHITAFALASAGIVMPTNCWPRVVDYPDNPAAIIAAGRELKITPLTIDPDVQSTITSVSTGAAVDHTTLALGLACSASKVQNPISNLIKQTKNEWNAAALRLVSANTTELPALIINVSSASSYRRCVEISELNLRCITKVKLAGTVRSQGQDVPIAAEAERAASVGGFCGSLARGIGVASREAVFALFTEAEHKVRAHQSTMLPAPS